MSNRVLAVSKHLVLEVKLPVGARRCYSCYTAGMNLTLVIRVCLVGLVALGMLLLWRKIPTFDVGTMFAVVLVGGLILGLIAVKFIAPWIGDTVATFFFSSGEVLKPDDSTKAVAKLAQGDYMGAIAEYGKVLKEKPDDLHAISEIARIYAEKLEAAPRALAFLQERFEGSEWPEDSAAFLLFRMADLQVEPLHDYAAAQALLEQVIARFPDTRHSANAHHKINEVQQAQFNAQRTQAPTSLA